MKKILPLLIVLLLLGITAVIFVSISKEEKMVSMIEGNTQMKALPLKVNFTHDAYCKMIITTKRNSIQVVSENGETWFFDDPGCMILWLQEKRFKDTAKVWIYTIDTKRWIDAREAWYGIADATAMQYGFGAREYKEKDNINFKEMQLRMLRGESLANPKIRKKLLGM